MSGPSKRRRLTSAAQFHDEEDVGEGLATNLGAGGPEHRPVEPARPELEGTAAAGAAAPPPDAWWAIPGQLELLQHTLGQLVITMAEVGSRAPTPATGFDGLRGVPAGLSPGKSGVRASSSAGATRELGAILEATPKPAAILCAEHGCAAHRDCRVRDRGSATHCGFPARRGARGDPGVRRRCSCRGDGVGRGWR
ncbi:unnamed protein product [Lampetra planeri]